MLADGKVLRCLADVWLHGEERVKPCAFAEREDRGGDLVHGVAPDEAVADDAVHRAAAGVEQPHVVVDFGCGGDGGARIARRVLLLDGDGRSEAVDQVDVRLLDALQELPRVGGERFDVAALALGIDGVEGERGFARAGDAGDDRELAVRDLEVDVFQVVGPRAADHDSVVHWRRIRSGLRGFGMHSSV